MARWLRLPVFLAAAVSLFGCSYNGGFRGPGYDPRLGVTAEAPVMVALTEATLRDDRAGSGKFWSNVFKVEGSLAERPGFIGRAVRIEIFGPRAWTMTVWSDEASLDAFVQSEAHQSAIAESLPALAKARFARFESDPSEVPLSWGEVLAIMETSSRSYDD